MKKFVAIVLMFTMVFGFTGCMEFDEITEVTYGNSGIPAFSNYISENDFKELQSCYYSPGTGEGKSSKAEIQQLEKEFSGADNTVLVYAFNPRYSVNEANSKEQYVPNQYTQEQLLVLQEAINQAKKYAEKYAAYLKKSFDNQQEITYEYNGFKMTVKAFLLNDTQDEFSPAIKVSITPLSILK